MGKSSLNPNKGKNSKLTVHKPTVYDVQLHRSLYGHIQGLEPPRITDHYYKRTEIRKNDNSQEEEE